MKVLITDKIDQSAGDIVKSVAEPVFMPTMSEEELCDVIKDFDAIMVRSQTKLTSKVISCAKNLKIAARAGVGVDNIDISAATEHGITVVNSPDGNTVAAAELTVAMMFASARNIPAASSSAKAGNWERSKFTGTELFGKTLGIIGFGKIGRHVAKISSAIGMNLIVFDPFATEDAVKNFGADYAKNLDELLEVADFITVHVPKTPQTAGMIGKEQFDKMKKGVRIVNCARGGIIDEKALKDALDEGIVASAALDVYENEPNIRQCPLLNCDKNVVLTPHLGASTKEAQIKVAKDVAEQVRDVLSGKNARTPVNKIGV